MFKEIIAAIFRKLKFPILIVLMVISMFFLINIPLLYSQFVKVDSILELNASNVKNLLGVHSTIEEISGQFAGNNQSDADYFSLPLDDGSFIAIKASGEEKRSLANKLSYAYGLVESGREQSIDPKLHLEWVGYLEVLPLHTQNQHSSYLSRQGYTQSEIDEKMLPYILVYSDIGDYIEMIVIGFISMVLMFVPYKKHWSMIGGLIFGCMTPYMLLKENYVVQPVRGILIGFLSISAIYCIIYYFKNFKAKGYDQESHTRSPVETWCADSYSLWSISQGGFHYCHGGSLKNNAGKTRMIRILTESWGIENAEQALLEIENMVRSSDRVANPAWNLCRAMQIASQSYIADYIDRAAMMERCIYIGKKMQAKFTSWDEMIYDYIDGYETWVTSSFTEKQAKTYIDSRRHIFEVYIKKINNPPFKEPWTLNLSSTQD